VGISFSTKIDSFCRSTGKILILLTLLRVTVSAEQLPIRFYSTADGLGSSAVNKLLFDSRGFLWLATRDGLSRFDGFRFTNYKFETETTADNVIQIIERRNGDYLAVKQTGEVYRFNNSTIVTESDTDSSLVLNAEKVYQKIPGKLLEDHDGNLWSGGEGGLSRILERDGKFVIEPPFPISPAGKEIKSLYYFIEDEAGTFWLTTDNDLVRITKDGRILEDYTTSQANAMRVDLSYLFPDRHGRLWVILSDGIFVLKPKTINNSLFIESGSLVPNITNKLPDNPGEIVKFTIADGLKGRVIPALQETADGQIWLASDSGLLVFEDGKFRLFNSENGIGEYLSSIVEDNNGNLWVSSFSGIYKLVRRGFTTFTKTDGLGRADIAAIYQTGSGEIFAAEGDWFISRFDGKKFVSAQPELGENRGSPVWTSNISFLDSHHSWWFLTTNKLFRYDNLKRIEDLSQAKPSAIFESNSSFKNGWFYRMFEDSRQNIWTSVRRASPEQKGLSRWRRDENKFYPFGEAENFPARMAPSSFCEDLQGNIWVGFYDGGLARYREGKFTVFTNADGLPQGFITALLPDQTGKLWIATAESGVHVIDDVSAQTPVFRKVKGISSNNVRALTEDSFGRIYAGSVRGIDRISPDTDQVLHLSTIDGLADDFVTVAFREQSGALWFGTRKGLSKFVPELDQPMNEPPILIGGVRIAGEKLPVSELGAKEVGNFDLNNTQNNLQINFFSVGLASPERVRYQYKLEGADEDWSKPTVERTVNYSNLAAGSYRFLVRAINEQGASSSQPAAVIFRISPPLWKSWWFLSLIGLTIVLIVYYLLYLRFQRRLELEKVRTRIATDLHDDIGASLSRISMLSEIVKHQNGITNPESAKRLTRIASEARGLVDSMSDIVWAINPRRDSIENVVDRVCSFAADTLGSKNVHWTVKTPSELKHLRLSAEQKRNLYLIFKEAINNSARHSNCQNASLKIHLERGKLIAEIFDDGKGFATENQTNENSRGGRGLENMQTRAKEIGGQLRIESKTNHGTRIILVLPIKTYRINGWLRRGRK
jgi:signal transduction histidine kinase/ligand-binding sensor domain-containing protein